MRIDPQSKGEGGVQSKDGQVNVEPESPKLGITHGKNKHNKEFRIDGNHYTTRE